ncbi:hypothetical protein CBR_g39932 [Chara braunii]|uniref:UspA domain-containing protein n=1 Tax=Chara braunii TaxID=69332 RepID=A0A388K1K7_CHABU|nr:hypothetical protein CBR_g39932 [Chara braunii]|eukprot:GBG63928.1 hypothetical protein CBR_g39932 [Chara braunii]
MQPLLDTPRNILIAVDESKGAELAFRWAVDCFIRPDDKIFLIHVRRSPWDQQGAPATGVKSSSGSVGLLPACIDFSMAMTMRFSPELAKKFDENSKTQADLTMEKYMALAAESQLQCAGNILEGDERDVICKEVLRVCADILIVGCRGLNPLQKAFLGSVSDYCARHSACPVVIVKPASKTRGANGEDEEPGGSFQVKEQEDMD